MTNGNGEESTIRISKKTKKRLEERGTLADTYESVIVRLLDQSEKKRGKKNGAP